MKRKYWIIFAIVIILILIPVVLTFAVGGPTNPPVENQVNWDSPATQELFSRACADCHSNETNWPSYSKIPPVSWLVIRDVNEGREKFNISATNIGKAEDAAEIVSEGEMPPSIYLLMHPQARLSKAETQTLITGLQKTFGGESGEGGGGDDDD